MDLTMGVEHIPTAAFGGYPAVPNGEAWPKQVINHIMEGWQATMVGWAKERPVVNRKSAHFTIGRGGRIVQHVSLWDCAWAVAWGDWNMHSIQIEHEGFSKSGPTYGQTNYGPTYPWPQAMVDASIKVHKWVFEAIRTYDVTVFPGQDTIIGHKDTGQPDRVDDPGQQWYAQVRPQVLSVVAPPVQGYTQADLDHERARGYGDGYRDGIRTGNNGALDAAIAAINAIPRN